MSPTIFAIAAVPAAVVYFVGLISKNRSKTQIAAIAMVLLGAVTGSPMYIVTDVFFVVMAYLWTSGNFTLPAAKVNSAVSAPARGEVVRAVIDVGSKVKEVVVALVMGVLAITAVLFILFCAVIWYNYTQKLPDPALSNPPTALNNRT